jgi:hypothetical protein
VQGVPSPFYGNYASHGNFTNLPPDGHVIASEEIGGLPTIVEYPMGAGWLVAFGQPLEISYDYGWDAGIIFGNTLLWGYEFEPALDVPWLSEDPTEGDVLADSSVDVTVTFSPDAGMPVGDYYATLRISTDDPFNPSTYVPVTMHIIEGGGTMHVQDIFGYFRYPYLVMRVQAADQDDNPLGNVLVDAAITMPTAEWGRWRFTKPSGWARFWAPVRDYGNYEICVENLTLTGYTYEPGDNVVTCMDWDWLP